MTPPHTGTGPFQPLQRCECQAATAACQRDVSVGDGRFLTRFFWCGSHGRSKRRKLRRTRQSTEGARRGSCSLAWPRTACSLPRRGGTGRRAAGMDYRDKVLVGVAAGIAAAALAAACVLLAIWLYRRRASVAAPTRSLESPSTTLRADGAHCASLDSSVSVSVVSECVADWGHPPPAKRAAFWAWRGGAGHNGREPSPLTVSGIPKYHYKYVNSCFLIFVFSCSYAFRQFYACFGTWACSRILHN